MVISLYVLSWLADIPIPRTNEIDIIFGYIGSMCQRKHGRERIQPWSFLFGKS
jgi:hypothetical protein